MDSKPHGYSDADVELALLRQGLNTCAKFVSDLNKHRSDLASLDSHHGNPDASARHADKIGQAVAFALADVERRLVRIEKRLSIAESEN
ncbi:hypothetical protein [Corynebacterium lowii]|uniref:Uncharacterized protein n=1 Tax=Corynebacterium lowii TaxID=1544413 RepID=A0A0N8VZT0_9CORY|nr:hypothetical protein [Corynebacterium lowii]KQB84754.1 hypothetical protein Clow_02012 [Corynebacterium lowii]MDP9851657.1 hypothetical protein [Corynebacterium lowii]